MSSSPLKSFNLGANYPFMDHTKGAIPIPPPPSQYAQGASTHFAMNYQQKPQPQPVSQPPSPLTPPLPQYPPPQMAGSYSASSVSSASSVPSSKGIFTLYRPDRDGSRTPELEDLLSAKKKPTWSRK